MKGCVFERSPGHWVIILDVRDRATGKRKRKWHSFKCNGQREADNECARLIASMGQGSYVERSKVTVGEFVRSRVTQWEAAGAITARTAQRYRQLVENQIAPHLGIRPLQKLTRLDVEAWHTTLRNGGLAARTIGYAHRVLSKALGDAERDGQIVKNVCKLQKAPKVPETEMVIVQDVPSFVSKLREAAGRLYAPATIALFTGMRLGEVLALRERSVMNLDKGVIEVREALEETKTFGVRFKTAKTKAGRRNITLPTIAIEALREHRKQLLETRLLLGQGRLAPDDLLFAGIEGQPVRPSAVSSDWGELAERIGMSDITFHGLRHTHASQLIASGVDIVTISKRLGHAKPSVTLAIYAHMFHTDDSKAAAAINAALGG
jgi:integrase